MQDSSHVHHHIGLLQMIRCINLITSLESATFVILLLIHFLRLHMINYNDSLRGMISIKPLLSTNRL